MFRKICAGLIALGLTTQAFAGYHMTPRQAFYYHAHKGNLSALQELKSMGHSVNMADEYGNSALCESVYRQDYSAFAMLKQAGATTAHPCVNKIPQQIVQQFNQGYANWAQAVNSGQIAYAGASTQTATAETATTATVATTTGLSTAAMVGIGVGAVAVVGGGIALAAGGGGGGSSSTPAACSGHGSKNTEGVCQCYTGYTGENCSDCAENYGTYGTSTCHLTKGCNTSHGSQKGDSCVCNAGWTGDELCNTATTCGTNYVASCPTGYTHSKTCKSGDSTLKLCDTCATNYTKIGGVCVAKISCNGHGTQTGAGVCTCNEGYDPSTNCSSCDSTHTLIGGACVTKLTCNHGNQTSATSCTCENFWESVGKNYCNTCPLTAGDTVDSAYCKCKDGYTRSGNTCVSTSSGGGSAKIYFKGLEKGGSLTIDESVTTSGLYEATSGKSYPMVAAYGVLNSNVYANVTVSSSSTLQNTSKGPLVYLQHANLTNNGTLKGSITMESQGTITNTSTGKIEGEVTLDGNISNAGEIKGSLSVTNNSDSDTTVENSGQMLFSDSTEDKITLAGSGDGDINFTNTTTGSIKNSLDISKGTLTNNGEIKLDENSMTFSVNEGGQVINTSAGKIDWIDALVLNGGTLENRGNLSTETGSIIVKGGTLENKASATLELPVPETYDNIMTANKIYSNGTVNNAGYLQGVVFSAGSVSNTGTIDGTVEAGGTFDGNDYFSAGTYSAGTIYNNGTINGLIDMYEEEFTYPAGIYMTGDGTFTNGPSGIINGAGLFENRTTKKLTVNNYGTIGITVVEGKDKDAVSFTNENGGIINDGVIQDGGTFVNKGTINGGVNIMDYRVDDKTPAETVFVNNGLIDANMNNPWAFASYLSTGLGEYEKLDYAVLITGLYSPVKFYNYGTIRVSNGQVVRTIGWDENSTSEEEIHGSVIKASGPKAYVYNEGTLEIKNSTLTTEDYTGSSPAITSVETLNDSSIANVGGEDNYFINLTQGASLMNSGYIDTGTSSLNTASFSKDGTGKVKLLPGAKLASQKSVEGNAYMTTDFVMNNSDTTVVAKDMIQTPDASKLNLISDSALFDAKLADNGSDVVMTMKGFDAATSNKSLAEFLSKNYALGNNEAFYNKLKSFGNVSALTDSLNKLTGRDMLSRFNFEDMTMMRELNFDMNDKLFHNKEQHFALAGSVSPMAFKGDTGSNARYSLFNKRDGNKSIGLGIAFTDVRSDDTHEDNDRHETSYQLILPLGYKAGGFNLVTSPRIGYARGTYDRTGFDGTNYDGTIEKRVFGLMNEARYPITVGKWKLEPSAEFNILGYQQRGHEDDKDYALNIQSQNTLSVEGGIGLYATREEELDKDTTLKLTAGMAAYHEFADPYKLRVGMNGMDGAFTLRDEKRSDNRGVIRAGFDYAYRDLSLYGSLISYIDREARTSAKTGMKVKF